MKISDANQSIDSFAYPEIGQLSANAARNWRKTIWKVIKVSVIAVLALSTSSVAAAPQELNMISRERAARVIYERLETDPRACCPRLQLFCTEDFNQCTIGGSRAWSPEELHSILYKPPSGSQSTYGGTYPHIFRRDNRGSYVIRFEGSADSRFGGGEL